MKNLKANNTLCKSFFDKDNNPLYLIEDLLEKLAIDKENICNSIKEFWDNLHTNNFPKIKEEYIRLLFGTKNEICDYGLISICGNVEENILGAETCLDLIAKFIDYEINPYCEICINILKITRMEHIKKMKLDKHLKSNNPIVINNASKILKTILNTEDTVNLNNIIKDSKIVEKFKIFFFEDHNN